MARLKRWTSKTGRPRTKAAALEEIEPPEDWTGSVDVDPEEDDARGTVGYDKEDDRRQSAGKLEGLDLFE